MRKWEQLCKKYAEQSGMPLEDVREIYKLYFDYIRDTTREYDIDTDYTEDEIKEKFPSFTLPGIGKLYVDYYRHKKYRKNKKKKYGEIQDEDGDRSERPQEEHAEA